MTRHSDADQAAAELRGAIEALGAPRAPRGLIGRVAAERARGLRAAIRGGEPASPPVVRRPVLWGAAALLVVGLVGLDRWPSVEEPAAEDAFLGGCGMNADARSWLAAGSLLLAAACAQEPDQSPFEPAAALAELQAGTLRPGTWVYELEHAGRFLSREVYRLTPVRLIDGLQWRSVNTRDGTDRVLADTMYYSADLRPLRQAWHTLRDGKDWRIVELVYGPTTVQMTSDYVDYRGPTPQRRTWWSRTADIPADPGPIVPGIHSPGLVYLMRLLPLRAGWSGSVQAGPFGTATFRLTSLRVVGEETIRVPAGEFDCWRVAMGAGPTGFQTLWVSKAERLLVRSRIGPEARGLEWGLKSFTPGD